MPGALKYLKKPPNSNETAIMKNVQKRYLKYLMNSDEDFWDIPDGQQKQDPGNWLISEEPDEIAGEEPILKPSPN